MTPRRVRHVCSACAVAGLVACAHLSAVTFIEASNPHQHFGARPQVVAEALPPEPDHAHRDFDRRVRIVEQTAAVASGGSFTITPQSGSYLVEGQQAGLGYGPRSTA